MALLLQALHLNLDLPPAQRWVDIATKHNASMHAGIEAFEAAAPTYKTLMALAAVLFKNESNARWLPPSEWEEITSIADITRIPAGKLVALNNLYDLTASSAFASDIATKECTSIVAQASAPSSHPVHGRNLDYPLKKAMSHITVMIDWQRNGTTLFSSVSFLGQVGFDTVMRHNHGAGGWSLSHDERDQGPISMNLVNVFLRQRMITFSRFRDVATKSATFSEAFAQLSSVPLDAPSYIILAGSSPGEGAIITRDRDKADDVQRLLKIYPKAEHPSWYLLETNYDHWKAPGAHDRRRDVANHALASVGRETAGTANGLLTVLSDRECNATAGQRPVLNADTAYTAIMVPQTNTFRVVTRFDVLKDHCVH